MSTVRILGIDPSTHMGIAVIDFDGTNVVTKTVYEFSSEHKGMDRLGDIMQHLIDIEKIYDPHLWAVEGYSYASLHNREIMYSIGTVIRYFLWQQECLHELIPPTSIKKLVCGKGNAKKDLVMKDAYKRFGIEGTDNEVDAYCIAMFALLRTNGLVNEKGECSWSKVNYAYDHSVLDVEKI